MSIHREYDSVAFAALPPYLLADYQCPTRNITSTVLSLTPFATVTSSDYMSVIQQNPSIGPAINVSSFAKMARSTE